jgi:hypothetical protein
MGAPPENPPQRHEAPVACPDWIDNNRNRVERLWARLKERRASRRAMSLTHPSQASAASLPLR